MCISNVQTFREDVRSVIPPNLSLLLTLYFFGAISCFLSPPTLSADSTSSIALPNIGTTAGFYTSPTKTASQGMYYRSLPRGEQALLSDSSVFLSLQSSSTRKIIGISFEDLLFRRNDAVISSVAAPHIREYKSTSQSQEWYEIGVEGTRPSGDKVPISTLQSGIALDFSEAKKPFHFVIEGAFEPEEVLELSGSDITVKFAEGAAAITIIGGSLNVELAKGDSYRVTAIPDASTIQSTFRIEIRWSSYYGGSRDENTPGGGSISTDTAGNIYVAGWTLSNDMIPPTPGRFPYSGNIDAFLSSFSGEGVLRWATYFGGRGNDYFFGLDVQKDGRCVAVGTIVGSEAVPVTAGRNTPIGGSDAVFAVFRSDGTYQASGLFGGASSDSAMAVSFTASGGFVAGGITTSDNLPLRPGSMPYRGNGDMLLASFDERNNLRWYSYIGSSATDICRGIAVLPTGEIALVGDAGSADFPSPNTFGGGTDIAVVLINDAGTILWSSLVGGRSADLGKNVTIAPDGSIFIVGETTSADFPVSEGNTSYQGQRDGCVLQFALNGTLVWSTCVGGSDREVIFDAAFDTRGFLYVVGSTRSTSATGFPLVGDVLYPTHAGGDDGFIAQYDTSGKLRWSTFFGGSRDDAITSVAFSNRGNIYFTGLTSSDDLPMINARQPQPGATDRVQFDAFLVAINPCTAPQPRLIADGPLQFCSAGSVTLFLEEQYERYRWSNGATSSSITVNTSGVYSVVVSNSRGCRLTSTSLTVTAFAAPPPLGLEVSENILSAVTPLPEGTFVWEYQGDTLTDNASTIALRGAGKYSVTLIDPNGCSVSTSAFVSVSNYEILPVNVTVLDNSVKITLHKVESFYTEEVPTDAVRGTISFFSTVFHPEAIEGAVLLANRLEDGLRIIEFEAEAGFDTLTITGKPLLGESIISPLTASLTADNPAALHSAAGSTFSLADVCMEGGARLINYPENSLRLHFISGAENSLRLRITIPPKEKLHVAGYTSHGVTAFEETLRPDENGFIEFSRASLATGNYILVLRLGAWVWTKKVSVGN